MIAGSGGTVGGTASGSYPANQQVMLTAAPDAGHLFLGWSTNPDGSMGTRPMAAIGTAPPIVSWANPLTFTLTSNTAVTALFAPRSSFPDVTPQTTGAVEPIAQLAARGVIHGYADGTFGPTDPTRRSQMAALIVRAMGWTGEAATNPFGDRDGVDDELWQAVAILAQRGVAKGYGGGQYGTSGYVLNAQVVSFITRAMVNQGSWQFQPDDGTIYPNIPATSGHRQDLVTYVHYAGAVHGTVDPHANFAGWDQPASRAWFALVLWQALDSTFGH